MRHPRLWWVAKSFTTIVKFHRDSCATNLLLKRTCASSSNRIVLRGRKENFAKCFVIYVAPSSRIVPSSKEYHERFEIFADLLSRWRYRGASRGHRHERTMHARGVIRRREENAKGGGMVERMTERAGGRGRAREVKKEGEVPFRRYVRYFVRGRVRKRDITRTLFHLRTRHHSISRPLRSVPFFLLPSSLRPVFHAFAPPSSQPSIRLHLTAFGETEPTPRITELSS